MRHQLLLSACALICLLAHPVAFAQNRSATRTDLVPRLLALENSWEAARKSQTARERATGFINQGVTSFFAGQFSALSRSFARAEYALQSEGEPSPEFMRAYALRITVPRALGGKTELMLEIANDFPPPDEAKPLQVRWLLLDTNDKELQSGSLSLTDFKEDPLQQTVSMRGLNEGDYWLQFEISAENKRLRAWRERLSVIPEADIRLDALQKRFADQKEKMEPIERDSVQMWLQVLSSALKGQSPESQYPLSQLMVRAETALQRESGKPFWQLKPGDYWMAASHNNRVVPFRLFIPTWINGDVPVPLIVALHGAGGNEHLFFEGYGLGLILKEAEKRGWAVVAPRSGVGLDHIWGAIEAAKGLVPVDEKKTYLIGHSMGGGQTFAAAAQKPDLFAGIAVFAGAGQPAEAFKTAFENKPVFLSVGKQEIAFLSSNVNQAQNRLKAMGLKRLETRVYEGCEHLMIVRESLPDAFAWFEKEK